MGCEAVPEGMRGHALVNAHPRYRSFHGLAINIGMDMISPHTRQSAWEIHPRLTIRPVVLPDLSYCVNLRGETILSPFPWRTV